MHSSRLYQAYQALSLSEKKQFARWIDSPFFCRQDATKRLYRYLSAHTPVYEDAYTAVFGTEGSFKTQSAALRLIMSDLMDQLERFLVYQEKFGSERTDYFILLAAAYRKKGLEKHFRQSLHQARTKLEKQVYRHSEYFETQAQIEFEDYKNMSTGRRTEKLNVQALSDQSDIAFIAGKLRQACIAISHQTVYKATYDYGLLYPILEYLKKTPNLLEIPAIGLYYYCFLFLSDIENEGPFLQFKVILLEKGAQFPEEEQRNLYLLAINYCVRKINQLKSAYYKETLDLYKSALQGHLLMENGVLSHFAFNNIVAIALRIHETAWVQAFIPEYAPFLEKKYRDATSHLNLARLAYVKKQYREALLHLQEADYKDLINNLIAKTLMMKVYYETDELEALHTHLQSMKTFIRRQSGIGYHRSNYNNIIRYTERMMDLRRGDKKAVLELRTKIEAEPVLTEKEWFLEQLA